MPKTIAAIIFIVTVMLSNLARPVMAQNIPPLDNGMNDPELNEEIRWLQAESVVITASKKVQRIDHAPSVVTVYTAEDIERQGLRNISEILDRTVGYFTTRNAANPLIGNRGIVAGENEPYLLLIDGHNMNSIVDKGPDDYPIFPLISHIKRVEIIRGPGSTLWGSDAALGIIHLITKDGKDIAGVKTTLDYASEDLYRYANIQYGSDGSDPHQDLMLSFTYAKSDGYPKEGFVPHENWRPFGLWGPMDKIRDSWELYGKLHQNDFTITTRASDLMDSRLNQSIGAQDQKYNRRRHYFLNIGHLKNFSKTFSLETKVFTNLMERWQQMANPEISPGLNTLDESFSSRENNIGAELMLRETLFDRHHLLAGCQFVQTEIDPVIWDATHPRPGTTGTADYRLLVAPEDKDQTMALYVEDDWQILNELHLIFGLRVDNNDLREDSTKLLPRFAASWGISSRWTAKYMFNTGYVRPPVGKSFLGQQPTSMWGLPSLGVEKSEEVQSHDLQLIYHRTRFQGTLTGYYTTFDNAFNFFGRTVDTEAGPVIPLYVNSNKISSYGLEFDFHHKISNLFDWYGNYAWIIFAEMDTFTGTTTAGVPYDWLNSYLVTDGKALTQFPHHTWNLGVNFFLDGVFKLLPHSSLNVHYRGWTDMWAEKPDFPGTYLRLGPEHFVDVNLLFKNIATEKLDISLYAKNVLDNDDSRYQLPLAGFWSVRGRSIGIRASYTF